AVTKATLDSFQYDSAGRLASIADGYGNTTTIERDSSGTATAIAGPFGDRTQLVVQNGYLASVTDPAGQQYQMTYTADGLLTGFKNPRNIQKSVFYDSLGRFIREDRADGGSLTITGPSTVGGSFQVVVRSAEGQATTHDIERSATGDDTRTDTDTFTLLQTKTSRPADGSQTITLPNGATIAQTITGDPRFLSLAPLQSVSVRTPAGRRLSSQVTRSVTLSNRFDPLSVASFSETLSLNGRPWQSSYTSANRTLVTRSPFGRQTTAILNAQGDPLSVQLTGIAAIGFGYNGKGQLSSMQQGSRQTSFTYNPSGLVSQITDPLSRTVKFDYDKAGRVTQQTLPDGRVIGFSYDANGNVTSITPPSRPQHGLAWTLRDQQQEYSPPAVSGGGPTEYGYNRDRQLTSVLRPDGQSIALAYDGASRLTTLTTPAGLTTYGYSTQTGALTSISAPGGVGLSYQYDGPLVTSVSWTGPVAGSIGYAYDNDLRVVSEGGMSFGYDADGLLSSAGALQLRRDSGNGLLTGTTLGSITDSYSYNEFGEVTGYTASFNGSAFFSEGYVRDGVGRIAQRTETVLGAISIESFGYDTAGRLTSVSEGVNTTQYSYDANSNRTAKTRGTTSESGTYDAQ